MLWNPNKMSQRSICYCSVRGPITITTRTRERTLIFMTCLPAQVIGNQARRTCTHAVPGTRDRASERPWVDRLGRLTNRGRTDRQGADDCSDRGATAPAGSAVTAQPQWPRHARRCEWIDSSVDALATIVDTSVTSWNAHSIGARTFGRQNTRATEVFCNSRVRLRIRYGPKII